MLYYYTFINMLYYNINLTLGRDELVLMEREIIKKNYLLAPEVVKQSRIGYILP